MACRCAPALVALRDELTVMFPARDTTSDGCCGDVAHSLRRSDHNPTDGYAHALDVDEDIEPGRTLLWLRPILLADRRSKYVIYEGTISYPGHVARPYRGVNAHRHHLHLSIRLDATFDTSPWIIPPDVPSQEDRLASTRTEEALARAQLVETWYRTIAGGSPDPAGYCYWLEQLEDGDDPTPGPASLRWCCRRRRLDVPSAGRLTSDG